MEKFPVIAKNLRDIRNRMGLSLSEASNLTGVSKTMLSQIERGSRFLHFPHCGKFQMV